MKRKVCIVTGSRAEYYLLRPLLRVIKSDSFFKLQLIVTGMHLSRKFGLTYREIEKDGFVINEKANTQISGDNSISISKSLALGISGLAKAFHRLKPDVVVLVGDRFEIFSAAQAAMVARIPIAHIHGGESTEGAIDEAIRHSITKMSYWHFVAAVPYRQRVIQLGEHPNRVFNVGGLGVENVLQAALYSRQEFESIYNFKFGPKTFLITYHPETLAKGRSEIGLKALLKALDYFPDASLIFTQPNCDMESGILVKLIKKYIASRRGQTLFSACLGQKGYMSAMHYSDLVIGNSSSGILEAPIMGKPSVNIGIRQLGRIRSVSVIDCAESEKKIYQAICRALSRSFREGLISVRSPFGTGNAAKKIKNLLKRVKINRETLLKKFYDIPFKT